MGDKKKLKKGGVVFYFLRDVEKRVDLGRGNKHSFKYGLIHILFLNKTRGSKEPVSLTLIYVNIKQRTQMDS